MTENNHAPQIILPICPHCGSDPLMFGWRDATFPDGLVTKVFCCISCRKAITIQAVGQQQPQIVPATQMPRIIS